MGIADGCGHRDQLVRDQALASLEFPALLAAAQLLAGLGMQVARDSSKLTSISAMAPGDIISMLVR